MRRFRLLGWWRRRGWLRSGNSVRIDGDAGKCPGDARLERCDFGDELQREERHGIRRAVYEGGQCCNHFLYGLEPLERDDILLRRVGGEREWREREFGRSFGDAVGAAVRPIGLDRYPRKSSGEFDLEHGRDCGQVQREAGDHVRWAIYDAFQSHEHELYGFERDEWDDVLLRSVGGECGRREFEFGREVGDAERALDECQRDD
jgi:hypothetical protein